MKVVRLLLKVFGIYMIFDVLCIAYIGVGELLEEYQENDYKNINACNKNVLDRAIEKIKDYYRK